MQVNFSIFIPMLVVFLGVMGYLAWLGYKKTTTSQDYLLAGKDVHPFIMALSYGAAFISSAAIIGFGGLAGQFGFQLMWVVFLNIAIGILVAYMVFGKRMRKVGYNLDASTYPDFLAKRFGSSFSRWFSAGVIFLFMPLYAASVVIGSARFLQETLQTPFMIAAIIYIVIVAIYVVTGGLKGVVFVDTFLGSVMLVGMLFLIVWLYSELGGVVPAHQQLTAMKDLVPAKLVEGGHQGWTAFPVFNSNFWWLSISSLMMGIGLGVLAQPQLLVRFMTIKSSKEINRALVIGAIFILVVVGTAYIAGALSNVYFFNSSGQIALDVAKGNVDLIMPKFINTFLPEWFIYLFLLILVSAAISTSAAQFHTIGTALGKDIYEDGVAKKQNLSGSLLWKRIGIGISIVFTFVLAIWVLPEGVVAVATAFFFAIAAATFLAPTIGALFWRGATASGVNASMIVGLSASILWALFFYGKTATGFGIKPLLPAPWIYMDPGLIGLPLSLITMFVVSKFTKPVPKEIIEKSFK